MNRRILWAVFLVVGGCQPARPSGPEAAYRAFEDAVTHQNAAGAWALLSASSQRGIEARVKAASEAFPGQIAPEPSSVLIQSGVRTVAGAVTVKSHDGRHAVLEIALDSGRRDVEMVEENGQWRVALPLAIAAMDRK